MTIYILYYVYPEMNAYADCIGEKGEGSFIHGFYSTLDKAKAELKALAESDIPLKTTHKITWNEDETKFEIGCDRYFIRQGEIK